VTVVSNTSPITNLAAIDQLHLLREIYGTILIPQAVYDELTVFDRPVPGTAEVQMFDWINVRRVTDRNQVANLRQVVDAGEAEAIALALELSAERLLIDEASGRALAESLGLSITGIFGTLLIAKQRGLVLSSQPLMEDLIQKAGFWVSPGLYRLVLDSAGE
jgi:predicted nucleic acid-binding protein